MNDVDQRPSPSALAIVVGLAFSDADAAAFDQAVRIAERVPGSELHLVHVFPSPPSEDEARGLRDHLGLYVDEKAATVSGLVGMRVGIHLRAGKAAPEIAQLAADVNADLIVVGSHEGPRLRSWVVGSTAERLVAHAPCPVVVASRVPESAPPHEPAIEPPCPDCVRARAASKGADWWCERHAHPAKRAHAYSYQREVPFASHDSEVVPTGAPGDAVR